MDLLLEGKKQALEILKDKNLVEELSKYDPTPTKKYVVVYAKFYKKGIGAFQSDIRAYDRFIDELKDLAPMIAESEKRGFKIDVSSMDSIYALKMELQSNLKKLTGGKKKMGLPGMKEGEDYAIVYHKGLVWGYTPFNWEASKVLGSKYLKGCEGKWCTSYQKSDYHWKDEQKDEYRLVIMVDYSEESEWDKVAIKISLDYYDNIDYQLWDKYDHKQYDNDMMNMIGITDDDIRSMQKKLISYNDEGKYDIDITRIYFALINSMSDYYGENNDFDARFGIDISLYSREDGGDSELEEENQFETVCNGEIKYMEEGTFISGELEDLYSMLNINIDNNNGVLIYADEFDADDGVNEILNEWREKYTPFEDSDNYDTYEIDRAIRDTCFGKEIDYIIINTDEAIINTTVSELIDCLDPDRPNDKEILKKGEYEREVDKEGTTWYLYILSGYKDNNNNMNRASTSMQRKRDKQLDFVYESFPRKKYRIK